MKKSIWVVVGVLVIVGAIWLSQQGGELASQPSPQAMADKREDAENTKRGTGGSGSVPTMDDMKVVPPKNDVISENPKLSARVQALLLQDGKVHNYPSLLTEINKLSYALSDSDVAALMEMLAWPNDRFPEGMRPIEINAVKNDVLDKLLRQTKLPEGIGLRMAEMAADPNQDVVWRDYCIQFCPTAWERLNAECRTSNNEQGISKEENQSSEGSVSSSVAGGENKPDELQVIREAMLGALDERGSMIAGTALIGLENLSRTYDEFDRELIVSKAAEIASDESASASSRLTALRMGSDLATKERKENKDSAADGNLKPDTGNLKPEVAEAARSIAQTGETVLLRSAAIVTLGEVGSEADRELLMSYLSDENRQIAGAAQMALDKMDARSQLMSDG